MLKTLASIIVFGMGTASACPFQSFLDLEKIGPKQDNPSTRISDRVRWEDSLQVEFEKGTYSFFKLYQEGSLKNLDQECPLTTDRLKDKLENNFSFLFLRYSASQLSESKSAPVQTFAKKIVVHFSQALITPTQLFLDIHQHHTTDKPAGYDRTSKGLFFDLQKIDAKTFPVYLIHEFAHAFDPKLSEAIHTFNNAELTDKVASFVRAKKTLSQLTEQEKALLKTYILAGLNRGVLAELRAWVITSELYLQLRFYREQSPVDFLDQIIGTRTDLSRSELTTIWWTHLQKNFEKPHESLFAGPLLQDALQQILDELNPELFL